MTVRTTIDCATASGKPLSELSRLIGERVRRLGELTKDAAIATAIDVLKSLRAATLDARRTRKFHTKVKERRDLYLSFRTVEGGSRRVPCLRHGSPTGPLVKNAYLRFVEKPIDLKRASIYWVESEHERMAGYFCAAYSPESAAEHESKRALSRIKERGGLARAALGVAMAKLSTRNTGDSTPKLARVLASRLARVDVWGSGFSSGEFGVEYRSELDYGVAALKGGKGAMDSSLKAAANKIAGQLTHAAHRAGDFEHDITTPFPEVKKRR